MRPKLLAASLLAAAACAGCKKEPAPPAPPSSASSSAALPAPSASAPSAATPAGDSAGVVRLPAEVGAGDELGYSVGSVGDRVVVTSFKRRGKTEDSHPGSVFVFKDSGGKLELEAELVAPGSHQLGNAVAFDGSVILAGALYDDGKSKETGAAYVFSRDDKGWSKGEKLSASDAKKDDSFGIGVALAGSTLVVGNSREAGGALYGFERGKAGFGLKQTLPFKHQNGPAEVISASGDLVVVGAPYSGKLNEQGLVIVYRRGKAGFEQVAELVETEAAETQHFGSTVTVAGTTLAATSDKQISLFSETDGAWKESARFTPPLTTGLADAALALGDGLLAVGFPLVEAGRVLLYKKRDGGWKLERTVTAPDGKNEDWFGYSLAISNERLVIGAPLVAERTGAAYVLRL
ncbi:MAG: FG-GAP repeat protein [Polyangiaceae bacterium]|nr:FG-GAP repeat protein [Polyangiaceae bacterium]